MAEASVMRVEAMERTPLRVRLRRAFHGARSAVLPRRWVIRWEMRENSRHYARIVAEARARKASRDEIQGLESEAAHYYWELEEELEMLESSLLLRQAGTYMLATPEMRMRDSDPNWRRGTRFRPDWYLTSAAMQDLRTRIRAERKARREPIAEWLKIGGAIIGGLGGATYLIERLATLL